MAALKEELVVALAKAVRALEGAGLPHALVGGLAVGARTEPRVTRDVDFVIPVTDDSDAELKVLSLQRSGFIVESVFEREGGRISTVRTRHPAAREVFVDFLLSNPRIEAEIVSDASRETIVRAVRCRVAQSWHLIAMKVLANRRKDQADLGELIARATPVTISKARRALRLMAARGAGGRRDLASELKRHVASVKGETLERETSGARVRRIMRRNPKPTTPR